jgi:hypothetical protein
VAGSVEYAGSVSRAEGAGDVFTGVGASGLRVCGGFVGRSGDVSSVFV